jgi:hypothetical protein
VILRLLPYSVSLSVVQTLEYIIDLPALIFSGLSCSGICYVAYFMLTVDLLILSLFYLSIFVDSPERPS